MLYICAKFLTKFRFSQTFTITSPHKPVGGLIVKLDSSLVLLTLIAGNFLNLRRRNQSTSLHYRNMK